MPRWNAGPANYPAKSGPQKDPSARLGCVREGVGVSPRPGFLGGNLFLVQPLIFDACGFVQYEFAKPNRHVKRKNFPGEIGCNH